jgi:tetratricopeptide (TPR) repeat protein
VKSRTHAIICALTLALCVGCNRNADDPLAEIRTLQEAGRFQESLEPLRALVEAREGGGEAAYRYAVAISQTGGSTQAIWSLKEAMKDPKWEIVSANLLAEIALRSANPDLAIETLDGILEKHPDSVESLLIRCRARLNNRRDYEGALADADKLLELAPERKDLVPLRVVALLGLRRTDEAGKAFETLEQEQLEGEHPNVQSAALVCASRARFKHESAEFDAAEKAYEECLERYPSDVGVVSEALSFFEERHKPERVEGILVAATEAAPEQGYFRVTLARWHQTHGAMDKALALLRSATEGERGEKNADAWRDLAAFLVQNGHKAEGIAAWRKTLSIAAVKDDPELLFAFGEALMAGGEHDEARSVAEKLQFPPYRELLLARIDSALGNYLSALAHFTEGNRLWPNSATARYFTARAAEQVGDFDRAIEEYRASLRSGANDTDTRLRLGRLYVAQRAYADAAFALSYQGNGEEPVVRTSESVLLEFEAHGALGDLAKGVPQALSPYLREPEFWGSALAAIAKGVRVRAGAQAAADLVQQADRLDLTLPVNAPALRSLVGDLATLGKHDDAIAAAKRAAATAKSAAFEEILGAALSAAGKRDEAAAAFERALAIEADHSASLFGLAKLAIARGDGAASLRYLERIDENAPESGEASVERSSLLVAQGKLGDAATLLRAALERDPVDGAIALALASLEGAGAPASEERIALAKRALRFGHAEAARALLEKLGAKAETGSS